MILVRGSWLTVVWDEGCRLSGPSVSHHLPGWPGPSHRVLVTQFLQAARQGTLHIWCFSLLASCLLISHWSKQGTWPIQTGVEHGELDSTSWYGGEIGGLLVATYLSNVFPALLFAIFCFLFFFFLISSKGAPCFVILTSLSYVCKYTLFVVSLTVLKTFFLKKFFLIRVWGNTHVSTIFFLPDLAILFFPV